MRAINLDLKSRMEDMGIIGECGFAYGFAKFPEESKIFGEFIKIADQRMYLKKKEMKNHS